MEGVKVAAVSPVEPAMEAAEARRTCPRRSIEVPAEAGRCRCARRPPPATPRRSSRSPRATPKAAACRPTWPRPRNGTRSRPRLGFAPAQYRIGNFYEKGLGVARDIAKSRSWYQKAAEQGNASAMHNLAVLYAMGADGGTDNDAAAKWFVKAAELGVKDSQFNLGILAPRASACRRAWKNPTNGSRWSPRPATRTPPTSATRSPTRCAPSSCERARAATELWKPKPLDAEANTVEIPERLAGRRRQDRQRRHEEGGPEHPGRSSTRTATRPAIPTA